MVCSVEEIHLNDIGTVFEIPLLDCDVAASDINTATVKTVFFMKPDGTTLVTKDAEFKTDGTDAIIQYTTIDGDLDQTGTWKIQARVTLPIGTWSSEIKTFKVYANLDTVV